MAFITGHAREGGEDELDESVTASADPHTTLVVYMGLNTLPALLERLQAAGLSPDTPAAAVERGTTLQQRAVYAPLERLTQVKAPCMSMYSCGVSKAPLLPLLEFCDIFGAMDCAAC